MRIPGWILCVGVLTGPLCWADGVQCWVNGAANLNFGTVGYRTPADTWQSLNYACQTPWDASGVVWHVRMCHFIEADSVLPGVAPRSLRHWSGARMQYDIWHDAAHTQLTGPTGSLWPMDTWTRDINSNTQLQALLTLYARAPAGQGALVSGVYESHFAGGRFRWRWSRGSAPVPSAEQCRTGSGGEGGGEVSYFLNVTGSAEEGCFIRSVTDLDFGERSELSRGPADQQGTVSVSCPLSVPWTLTLDAGIHAAGGQRQMMNNQGDRLMYGLYRDAARTQPWTMSSGVSGLGKGLGSVNAVPVFGRVPVQPAVRPGTYSDTVTVTLTY